MRSIAHFFSNRQLRRCTASDERNDAADPSVDPASAVRHVQPQSSELRGEPADVAEPEGARGQVQDDLAQALSLSPEHPLRAHGDGLAEPSGNGHGHFYRVRRDRWAMQRAERAARAGQSSHQLESIADDLLLGLRVAIDDLYDLTDPGLDRVVDESRTLPDDYFRGREFLRRNR